MHKSCSGFTLIELMIVVGIIGILAAVAIPGYIGLQNKFRREAMEEAGVSAKYELYAWITSARALPPKDLLKEVDTNYDGDVTTADMSNGALAAFAGGVSGAYIDARTNGAGMNGAELSPFAGTTNVAVGTVLWAAANGAGQISLVDATDSNGVVNRVDMTGIDNLSIDIFTEAVSSD